MWFFIFGFIIIALGGCIAYLISRLCKFNFINKISKGKRKNKIIISLLIVLVGFIALYFSLNFMNAIVCVIHIACIWLIFDFIFWTIKRLRKKSFKIYLSGILAVAFSVCYLGAGWYLANNVWQTDYKIATNKFVGNIRIVQFADSHIGTTFNGAELEKYVDEMNACNPDVVLITGDFVDESTSKKDMTDACKALSELKTTYGVYFSFGNHDKGNYSNGTRGYDGNDLINELEKNNVIVLQDQTVLIDNRFYIIGRQDRSEESENRGGRASMTDLVKNLDKDKLSIVMDHQPSDYENQAKSQVDLVLSGHTHGGQFFPINKFGEWVGENDRTYGFEIRNKTDFIVTSGISDWAVKFKTGCKSEFVVIDVNEK